MEYLHFFFPSCSLLFFLLAHPSNQSQILQEVLSFYYSNIELDKRERSLWFVFILLKYDFESNLTQIVLITWNTVNFQYFICRQNSLKLLGIKITSLPTVPGKTFPFGSTSLRLGALYLARIPMSLCPLEKEVAIMHNQYLLFSPVHLCVFMCVCACVCVCVCVR